MTTRVIAGASAILQPAVISPLWSAALYTRLYIHRNSISPSKLANPDSVPIQQIRFISILKGNGKTYHDFESGIEGKVVIVIVQIHDGGISDVELLGPLTPAPTRPTLKDKRVLFSESPDATPSASPLAKLSEEADPDPDPSQVSAIPPETPAAQSPPPTPPPLSPPPPSPSYSAAFTPRSQSLVATGSPEPKRRKTGLELGVVRGSDEEDTDEDWSDEEGGLDDGGAPVKMTAAAADTDGVNGPTTFAIAGQEDGKEGS